VDLGWYGGRAGRDPELPATEPGRSGRRSLAARATAAYWNAPWTTACYDSGNQCTDMQGQVARCCEFGKPAGMELELSGPPHHVPLRHCLQHQKRITAYARASARRCPAIWWWRTCNCLRLFRRRHTPSAIDGAQLRLAGDQYPAIASRWTHRRPAIRPRPVSIPGHYVTHTGIRQYTVCAELGRGMFEVVAQPRNYPET